MMIRFKNWTFSIQILSHKMKKSPILEPNSHEYELILNNWTQNFDYSMIIFFKNWAFLFESIRI